MKEVTRANKLVVVADESGNIRSAMWPGIQSEGAPTYAGIGVPADQVAHEVDVPKELYEAARPDLSDYILETTKGRPAALVRRSGKKESK
jgi:hypothetical protein